MKNVTNFIEYLKNQIKSLCSKFNSIDLIKLLTIIIPVVIAFCLIASCTSNKDIHLQNSKSIATVYFHKGVYKSYSTNKKNQDWNDFYIFDNENAGHTEDSKLGIGLPFSCVQTEGIVKFKFGGIDEPEEILEIKSVKDGIITASFKNGQLLKFIPITDANPDSFDAIEYIKYEKK